MSGNDLITFGSNNFKMADCSTALFIISRNAKNVNESFSSVFVTFGIYLIVGKNLPKSDCQKAVDSQMAPMTL